MAKFIKGDVVVIPFPFSDLTQTKRRPALVISALEGVDKGFRNFDFTPESSFWASEERRE